MRPAHTIEVPVPDALAADAAEVQLLKGVFEALVAVRCERRGGWQKQLEALQRDGWSVRWGLRWCANAHRGNDSESATGVTLEEALSELVQMTRLDTVGALP